MAKAGKNARIKVMSDASAVPFTSEATTADASRIEYRITNRTKRYWSRTTPVVVETSPNGSTWTVVTSGYRIAHAGGKIMFYVPRATGTQVRVSGAFVAVTTVAEVREYTMSGTNALVDVTVLESDGWRKQLSTIRGASGSLTGFYNVNNLLQDKLLSGTALVVELDVDSSDNNGEYFAFYALLASQELSVAVDGAVGTSVPWESDGDILIEAK